MKIEQVVVDELPRDCYECYFGICGSIYKISDLKNERFSYDCFLTHKACTSTKRNRFCPLVQKAREE